jgi:hypothetical protein
MLRRFEIRLGKRRLMIGNIRLIVDEDNVSGITFLTKADCGLRARMARAYNNASLVHRTSGNFRAS